MRILIVGFGSIGQRHCKNLQRLGITDIWLLRSKIGPKDKIIDGQFKTKTIYTLHEALKLKPTAVLITNPTHRHVSLALPFARAGCHLFIEKPLSDRLNGVATLEKLIKKNKLVSLIGCNQRFHPQLSQIKKIIDQDTIGSIVSARLEVGQYLPDWHPGEDYTKSYAARKEMGGGVILTLIHEIDYAYWLLGKMKRVACLAPRSKVLTLNVEDNAEMIFESKSGTLLEIHLDYLQRSLTRQYQFFGTRGSLVWDYETSLLKIFTINEKKWKSSIAPNFDRNDMFVNEMKHFLNCTRKKEKSINPIQDGTEVLKLALLAKQSAQSHRVITIK